jgi:hypothetical protein
MDVSKKREGIYSTHSSALSPINITHGNSFNIKLGVPQGSEMAPHHFVDSNGFPIIGAFQMTADGSIILNQAAYGGATTNDKIMIDDSNVSNSSAIMYNSVEN